MVTRHDFFEPEKRLIEALMKNHPWPWTITHDWMTEIHDAQGSRFIDCYNPKEAMHILKIGLKHHHFKLKCAADMEEFERTGKWPDEHRDNT